MAESEEELKSLLMKVKEESEKSGLKLNIQKTKIMASGPITSWQIEGTLPSTELCCCRLHQRVPSPENAGLAFRTGRALASPRDLHHGPAQLVSAT